MTISIHYNGVILRDCEVRSFEQQMILDEGGTDLVYCKFSISVSATLIDYDYSEGNELKTVIDPGKTIEPTVQRMDLLHSKLSQPRKDFWMTVGGQSPPALTDELTLLLAAGTLSDGGSTVMYRHPIDLNQGYVSRQANIDVQGGPHPENVKIDQIFGGRAMRVSVTFRVARRICDPDFTDTKPDPDPRIKAESLVLSNRWYLDETKDDNWVTTKTLQGTLRTLHPDYFAQLYRHLCIPPLMTGYRRESQSFVSDTTNTVLKYRITDRQVHAAPPPPAVAWDGTHTESTTAQGARQTANVSVRLTGPPGVDKRDLIATAGRVIVSRIAGLQKKGATDSYETVLQNLNIVDHIAQPTIEMSASAYYTSSEYKWLAQRVLTMTKALDDSLGIDGYIPTQSPVPLAYDSVSPVGIFACYLQNPCSQWHGMGGGLVEDKPISNDREPSKPAYPADSYEYPPVQNLDEDENRIEYDTAERYNIYDFPYNFYTISHRYETAHGYLHLPYATEPDADVTSTVIPVHGGITEHIIEWEATRDGRPPVIPHPKKSIINANGVVETLLESTMIPRAPELTSDGRTRRYGFAGRLVYAADRPPRIGEKLESGSLPADVAMPSEHLFDLAKFTDTDAKVSAQ